MLKVLTGAAALGLVLAFSPLSPADAAARKAPGVQEQSQPITDLSSHRRSYRHRHYSHRRYYRPRVYSGYGYPYYYRPYYRPYVAAAPFPFFPFGVGVGIW